MEKLSINIYAIVVGIGSYNDIGIIRSCGEVGIKSIYINTKRFNLIPIWKSKYLEKFLYLDTDNEILDYIKNYSQHHYDKKFVLFGASDAAVLLLDSNYDKFPNNVIVQHAKGSMSNLMDKAKMCEMAEDAGLKIPFTHTVDLKSCHLPETFPIILKPLESVNGNKSDITICQNLEQFKKVSITFKRKGYKKILAQQYIHSKESKEIGITGIAYLNGTVEFYGYIDKIRNRGNINNFGCYLPNEDLDIYEALTKYIKSTRYVGIFDTDFIIDKGFIYFIECNFRNGAYGYSITHAGFNMPLHFIQNKPLDNPQKLRKTIFMEERTDILNVLDKTVPIKAWIKDLLKTNTFLWWNWKDPKPMFRIPHIVKRLIFRN